jgi:hypothetical protein
VAAVTLVPEDFVPFADIPTAKAQAMIEDAVALAARVAPCILADEFTHDTAARAILRSAILRWNDAGSGAMTTESVDDYSGTVDTRQPRRSLFWPSEIEQLQDLCRTGTEDGGSFGIDTAPTLGITQHADICSLRFGALYCSCGAVLTMNLPLYENL